MPPNEIPRVLAAETVSNFGSMLSRLAIPWLAALVLLATPMQMAALLVADVLAGALGSVWLAGWVDRSGKRAVMLLADGLRFALMLVLAAATWWGWVSLPLLVAVAAANGLLGMAFELARSAWVAQRVPVADLPQRNAQLSMAGSLSETAAFALGGWLYQGLGAAMAFVVDAFSYVASALCLRRVGEVAPAPPAVPATHSPGTPLLSSLRQMYRQAAEGLQAVAERPALRALTGIEALGAFSFGLTGTAYTIFVTRDLGVPTGAAGVIAALGGAGAVLGAMLAPRLGRRIGPGRTMALGLVLFTAGAACIPMAALAPLLWGEVATTASATGVSPLAQGVAWGTLAWLVAHQVVGDTGHTLHDVHDRTLRQTAVPAHLLARADAGIRTAGQLALLAGALVGGVVGTAAGSQAVLWLAAAAGALAAVLAAVRLAER
jgi:MFS family permease